jgi:hypothetical protein
MCHAPAVEVDTHSNPDAQNEQLAQLACPVAVINGVHLHFTPA